MNFKTTILLLILVAAGVAAWVGYDSGWFGFSPRQQDAVADQSVPVLEGELTPEAIQRIEIAQGDRRVVLDRGPAGWTLPGRWPTREQDVQDLIGLLTNLQTRFAPLPIGEQDLGNYGLDRPVVVTVTAGEENTTHRLAFGEKAEESNRFPPLTYLRVDDRAEVLRLAPGLVEVLKRPLELPDFYQRRWLFLRKREKEGEDQKQVDRLDADAVAAGSANGSYALAHTGTGPNDWVLDKPVRDRIDPDKLKSILTALPDLWAEKFVDPKTLMSDAEKKTFRQAQAGAVASLLAAPAGDIAFAGPAWAPMTYWTEADWADVKTGLIFPAETLRVVKRSPGAKDDGTAVTLLIGKIAEIKERKAPTPPANPFGPPPPPAPPIEEEYRYARLRDNPQVFTVRADKLKDVFMDAAILRDTRLARFKNKDVREVEIEQNGQAIVFAKVKDHWRLQKPVDSDAEVSKVDELLDKLSGTTVAAADMLDHADAKAHGLNPPAATIKLKLEETEDDSTAATEDAKPKTARPAKKRTLVFEVGKHGDEKKCYVRLDGWERVNAVEDNLLKLAERPALAYRGRRVFDFSTADVARVEVRNGKEKYDLEQAKDAWRLGVPVDAEADATKANQLAGDLGRLEAVEYVNNGPNPEELDKEYGLSKPTVTATVWYADKARPAQKLVVGKQRGDKPEFFAQLVPADASPAEKPAAVFVVKKEVRDALEQTSLAFRPLQLWQMPAEEIADLKLQKEGKEYQLKRAGTAWQVVDAADDFEAVAMPALVQPMVNELAALKCERYETHAAEDPKVYGLDQPYLRVTLQPGQAKKDDKPGADKAKADHQKPKVLVIGKPTAKDSKSRFARLGEGKAVFVVGETMVAALDHGPLDLLDRTLLTLDPKVIGRIQKTGEAGPLTLSHDADTWRAEAAAAKFPADHEAVQKALAVWSNLQAERFAAYGPRADLPAYGLDKPAATITISVLPAELPGKVTAHTLALGKPVAGATGERYARLDSGPGVVVLARGTAEELARGYLDFVNRTLLRFDAALVNALHRKQGADVLQVFKQDDGWHLVKPAQQRADDKVLQGLVDELAALKAQRVAAYPAKDLTPFGLDDPALVVTLRLGEPGGKETQHVLKIGEAADKGAAHPSGDRFAQADGSDVVAVLPGALVRRLKAPPIQFRDHNLVRFPDADRVVLERGPRKAEFAKVNGTWKLTAPLEAEAEQTDLEDFVNDVARLRADEMVNDKPADNTYGLERPEARWRFLSGDKEVLNLLVGNREKVGADGKQVDGPRRYAKLAGGELIFLLDPKLSAKVVGEYRSRGLWASLDSAQVDRLSYGYAQRPFVLEKVNNTWQVEGRPEVKVNTTAVTETLDALARLKAERYVVDRGADFKLYGLEPPQLALEVNLPGGKRLLHVGRPEGDSKRYYARVVEGNRSDVFIISEADAGRIVRELQAFVEGPGKTAKVGP